LNPELCFQEFNRELCFQASNMNQAGRKDGAAAHMKAGVFGADSTTELGPKP
jgi:hypothetical protein